MAECRQAVHLETSKGTYQKQGLLFDAFSQENMRCIIDKPFLFGKSLTLFYGRLVLSDAELEESLENMPLLIARVDQENWAKI